MFRVIPLFPSGCLWPVRVKPYLNLRQNNQSVSNPQCHSSVTRDVITQHQQLADLCCVSHFAAVCTIFPLNCAVAPHIGNVYLIGLCGSQDYLLMQASEFYYYYSITRHGHFDPLLVPCNSYLPSPCLAFLHAVTDGHLRYVFLQHLNVFSPVTIFIFNRYLTEFILDVRVHPTEFPFKSSRVSDNKRFVSCEPSVMK